MTTRTAAQQQERQIGRNGSVVVVANSGNVSGFDPNDSPGLRRSMAYLASAYPAAKVDDKGAYWHILHTELADIPEPVLQAAVQEYIRTNDNAYRLPTVAELLKLSRKHRVMYDVEAQADRDVSQQAAWEAHQNDLRRVTQTVPAEDREEIARRVNAAYEAADDWMTAEQIIFTHLLDTDGPSVGWYSPTALIAVGMTTRMRAGRPTGDPSQSPPQGMVARIVEQYPGRFRARYSPRVEQLLDPDRLG